MKAQLLVSFLLTAVIGVNAATTFPRSVLNGPCTGKDGVIGVCVSTKSCTQDDGTYIDNACPNTPENIKCCTKPQCQLEARSGDCRWMDSCGGGKALVENLCPGPDAFRCCITSEGASSSVEQSSTATANPEPTKEPAPDVSLGEKILEKAKEAEGTPCKLP
jgi:hypothetical protein